MEGFDHFSLSTFRYLVCCDSVSHGTKAGYAAAHVALLAVALYVDVASWNVDVCLEGSVGISSCSQSTGKTCCRIQRSADASSLVFETSVRWKLS